MYDIAWWCLFIAMFVIPTIVGVLMAFAGSKLPHDIDIDPPNG